MVTPSSRVSRVDLFDGLATSYGGTSTSAADRVKASLLRAHAAEGDRVLDAGCGPARHLSGLGANGGLRVGVDLSREMLVQARTAAKSDVADLQFVQADLTALPLAAHSFDLVYSFSTLSLVPSLPAALDEISRVLRPGGTAIVDVTGRWHLSAAYFRRWWRRRGHGHFNALSYPSALDAVRSVGLVPERAIGSGLGDYWKFVPVLRRTRLGRRVIRWIDSRDLRWSNAPLLRHFANRWFVVAVKPLAADVDRPARLGSPV